MAYLNCRWNRSLKTVSVNFRSSNSWFCALAGSQVLHGKPKILLSLTYWDKLWKVKFKCQLGYRLAVWPWANCFFSLGLSFLTCEAGTVIPALLTSRSSKNKKVMHLFCFIKLGSCANGGPVHVDVVVARKELPETGINAGCGAAPRLFFWLPPGNFYEFMIVKWCFP